MPVGPFGVGVTGKSGAALPLTLAGRAVFFLPGCLSAPLFQPCRLCSWPCHELPLAEAVEDYEGSVEAPGLLSFKERV